MALGTDIGDILRQYEGGSEQGSNNVEQDFDQVARQAGSEQLQQGVAQALRSQNTPPFADLVGHLFGQADEQQRSALLSHLLAGAGPGLVSTILGTGNGRGMGGFLGDGAGLGAMGVLLGKVAGIGNGRPQLEAEDVSRLSPEQMQELARHAERENPAVVDVISRYLADHPQLVKTLGAGTVAHVLGAMARQRS